MFNEFKFQDEILKFIIQVLIFQFRFFFTKYLNKRDKNNTDYVLPTAETAVFFIIYALFINYCSNIKV